MSSTAAKTVFMLAAALCLWLIYKSSQNPSTPQTTLQTTAPPEHIEKAFLRAYKKSGDRYGVDWKLLAGIGWAESQHGRLRARGVQSGINFAGCCAGPMQICTQMSCGNVFATWGVDADRDGKKSPYDPQDSIATAARYISWMQETLGDNKQKLAAAYNAGPTLVQSQGVPSYPETQTYIKRVSREIARLQ